MRTKTTIAALAVIAGVASGTIACTSGSGTATHDPGAGTKITAWENEVVNDPGFKALDAEFNVGEPDLSNCDLYLNDSKAFADNHPTAPYGEKYWQSALDNLHAEIGSICDLDTDGAKAHYDQTLSDLGKLQDTLKDANGGKLPDSEIFADTK